MTVLTDSVSSPWITRAEMIGECSCDEDGHVANYDDAIVDTAILAASNWLYRLTDRRWPGTIGPLWVRPEVSPWFGAVGAACFPPQALTGSTTIYPGQTFGTGNFWPSPNSAYLDPLGCTSPSQVDLVGPVVEIVEVRVDGATLVEGTDWELRAGHRLIRLGGQYWPVCADQTKPLTEKGTFGVNYSYGRPPPPDCAPFVSILACELTKLFSPNPKNLRFSGRTTALVRDNLSVTMANPALTGTQDGWTSIPEVDAWIAQVNTMPEKGGWVGSIDTLSARLLRG